LLEISDAFVYPDPGNDKLRYCRLQETDSSEPYLRNSRLWQSL
jgi:hypothetical protein